MSNRPFYPGGPATLTFDAATYQMAEDWTASNEPEFFDISTSVDGVVDSRQKNIVGKASAAPLGIYSTLGIAKLFPWQPSMRGQLLFGSVDKPLVIQTKSGYSITYPAAGFSQSPEVTFTSQKAMFGNMELTMLLAAAALGSTAGDFATVAASAWTAPSLTPSTILTGRYTAAWGGATTGSMSNIRTESGLTFKVTCTWTPVPDDGIIVNYRLESVTVEVTFVPINLTEADLYGTLMPMDGPGTGAGTSRGGLGGSLVITGASTGMPILTIPSAFASRSGLRFGKDGRVNSVTIRALRKSVTGTLQDLFTWGIVA